MSRSLASPGGIPCTIGPSYTGKERKKERKVVARILYYNKNGYIVYMLHQFVIPHEAVSIHYIRCPYNTQHEVVSMVCTMVYCVVYYDDLCSLSAAINSVLVQCC